MMHGGWIVIGIVGYILLGIGVFALMKVSSESDRVARRTEKRMLPYSDVEVTEAGTGQ